MRCPTCEAENLEEAQICAQCHKPLADHPSAHGDGVNSSQGRQDTPQPSEGIHTSESGNEPSKTENPDPFDTNVKRVSAGVNIGIIIGTILFPVIGVAMGYTYLKKDHPEERKAGRNWLILGVVMFIVNIMLVNMLKK